MRDHQASCLSKSSLQPKNPSSMKLHSPRLFFSTLVLALLFSSPAPGAESAQASLEKNKLIVREFFDLAFNQHRPADAVKKHMGPHYIQHNPYAGDGGEAFIRFFEAFFKKNPDYRISIKRMIAEGDLVVVHLHAQNGTQDRGRAVVDIMRLENGKIVEHWDVVQPVPETAANDNTMF